MEKRALWHKWLIYCLLILTLYNILPTVFFYAKPLKKQISETEGTKIGYAIAKRVNHLEEESIQWLKAFCALIKVSPQKISLDETSPHLIAVEFKNPKESTLFKTYIERAGSLIPFTPAQISLHETEAIGGKTALLQRKISIHLPEKQLQEKEGSSFFQFSKKFTDEMQPTPLYQGIVFDRALQLAHIIIGETETARLVHTALSSPSLEGTNASSLSPLLELSQHLLSFSHAFGETSEIAKRYFASCFRLEGIDSAKAFEELLLGLQQAKDQLKLERITLHSQEQALKAKGEFLESSHKQRLEVVSSQEKKLSEAEGLLKKHKTIFSHSPVVPSKASLAETLYNTSSQNVAQTLQILHFGTSHPFIESLVIDWSKETIELRLHQDVIAFKETVRGKNHSYLRGQLEQLIYNSIAYASRLCDENILPLTSSSGTSALKETRGFYIKLSQLEGSKSFITLRLAPIAQSYLTSVRQSILDGWHPKHPDLSAASFPVWDEATYLSLPAHERKLGLLIYAPALHPEASSTSLHTSSIYVVAKGLNHILQKIQSSPHSEEAKTFIKDFNALKALLQKQSFFGYPGSTLCSTEFSNDFVFEMENFYAPILKATREEFSVHGSKRFALLEFTNKEQRLLVDNKIATLAHEELLRWRDDYYAASLGMSGSSRYDIPKPPQNILLSNLKLSLKKYFHGDERKVLHWGLDLSGGKTVQIELRDQNHRQVTGEKELQQGINELYNRVNKMGVSEVSIRREGNLISLDFPGSQELSASELIKSSSMYFHIANEKFNEKNPSLAEATKEFLQDIWNEAVITGRKTTEEINQIAWRHLHGDSLDSDLIQPRSDSARLLYEQGLRLASPFEKTATNSFNDTLSEIAIIRGDDFTKWHGNTHPLMVVFRNFALEGSNLKNVQSSYDQNKGNYLAFEIKGKETLLTGEKIHPREELYAWTSQFSKDRIGGTPYATLSKGDGWRMVVILNGTIITAPTLNYPVKDSAMIEGNFSQREVNQLEADLKAGSLSYTPKILSEKNVSPELGAKERTSAIIATFLSLALVILCMLVYYKFGGLVASIALIINLFMMWAILQNLGATLTLASVAGVILALGMAVDANVLVFERMREEFAAHKRIGLALQGGYKKAFPAILDSNVTTILAALILLQFDSGPIRGFAITLIIGIVSSMFTALFMTRYFFAGWVQNPAHKELKMARLIQAPKLNFLKWTRPALIGSSLILLAGAYAFFYGKTPVLGMDFTGGYALTLELPVKANIDYRQTVEKALFAQGLSSQDVQVRQLTPQNHIRLFLGRGLQQEGKPFFSLPIEQEKAKGAYAYEANPRLCWVIEALSKEGVSLLPESLSHLDKNWSEISGQLSQSMRNSALIGLALASAFILLYITFRFEIKYALSAAVCLIHDIVFCLAALALLNACHVPVQLDLHTLAALMTILGYSLNDTIIIFDRIREDLKLRRGEGSFAQIVNQALNTTLSRTIMTSSITLLVLIPLVFLGGSTLFSFSLLMVIGIIVGTLSSFFIATTALVFFHERGQKKGSEIEILET